MNCVTVPWYRAKSELSLWWGALLWKRTCHGNNISRCSFTSNAEILIDYLIFTKKRAGNTVLLLIYGSLGLFLNVINDKSLLKAWDIHQQNCMPLKQMLREFENIIMQSFTISIIVENDKLPKNKNHYNLETGINFCVFILTYFSLKLQGFHESVCGGHMTIDVNRNMWKLENKKEFTFQNFPVQNVRQQENGTFLKARN